MFKIRWSFLEIKLTVSSIFYSILCYIFNWSEPKNWNKIKNLILLTYLCLIRFFNRIVYKIRILILLMILFYLLNLFNSSFVKDKKFIYVLNAIFNAFQILNIYFKTLNIKLIYFTLLNYSNQLFFWNKIVLFIDIIQNWSY